MEIVSKRKNCCKCKGSILIITALAAVVWIFIAQSLFIVGAGGFGMIKSSRIALQAQQYAEIAVDKLKNIDYENLDADGVHSRQAITNIQEQGWEDEVSIGSEYPIQGSDDGKQRIATVNVYKTGDTLPRFTLEVPLSSQGGSSNINGIPKILYSDPYIDYGGIDDNGQHIPSIFTIYLRPVLVTEQGLKIPIDSKYEINKEDDGSPAIDKTYMLNFIVNKKILPQIQWTINDLVYDENTAYY